ncbi:Gfo/Idh/MocA family protein [Ruania halotolerans]|uniref:Gfo/Idh/MocA family protein n=1 Tax=Ruania halotolerans TaxID=2897773 RepID=UPI001E41CD10|nr:Gfo/Idh/MocA family oxidoreductase [Ruania halotolerans]UFU07200.1 Gfo/Idh/MocA family oxidoreductase [Ruania halotolerans]
MTAEGPRSGASRNVVGIGIVGLGKILSQYLETFERLPHARVVAVADLNAARAQEVAAEVGARALSVAELVADPEVDVVLNLTIPAAHATVAHAAIEAGKPVYSEKPIAASAAEAIGVLDAARAAGVRVGGAPDTVLGAGIQTARAAVDAGRIGTPTSATATFACAGHESWHPNPDFYYQAGGGPLLDMGPYYLTTLVTLLGEVTSVVGAARTARPTRTIGSGPRAGEIIEVAVATHVTGVLTHASGALSTIVMSFDTAGTESPKIEVHGTGGSLSVPDPNRFDGEVRLRELGSPEWEVLEPAAGDIRGGRGIGVLDLVGAASDAHVRASGALALHVLEVMEAVLGSAETGQALAIDSRVERPDPVPLIHS